ncbi:AraC family transcriptional regulator of adaptative response/methylated-DNA-[protein]-cysteine methyltransferase [Arcicella aurantiaca]|uniref:methylated-DNA--[protein]-cysteine S-methyltransferase n=1 Tax=Arcicella aurantiaca TaxID=591202 RepID=A0A316DFL1_9BACT|nr:methylated-DNA--[protein]-cysteine S-methyltransferase [Arcicella aurantiaca]PWK16864.1 AraC family transcriptional regulator of adaptative response/methylated-DNA-[protein]-cysteine methyltransferase [Arcicella aurantiaca]
MNTQQNIDYQRIEQAIQFIGQNFQRQPSLKEIAENVNLSEYHFDRMFTKWAGTSPQRFMRFLTKEYAKEVLTETKDLLDTTVMMGLSSSSRLHDLFVTYEAMTPAEYKRKGEGLSIIYGTHETPFGWAFIAITSRGVLELTFLSGTEPIEEFIRLKNEFPKAKFVENQEETAEYVNQIFVEKSDSKSINLLLRGTNFQIKVWEALLKIPSGNLACYEDIAQLIDKPTAQRAVGTAIGSNHIAYLIPCHRVIQKVGTTGNYRWGQYRKKAILGWEGARGL